MKAVVTVRNSSFHKYTSLGNVSMLIDELDEVVVPEKEKSQFAAEYLDSDFRWGGDEMIFVQKPDPGVFLEIAEAFPHYWPSDELKGIISNVRWSQLDCLFRVFDSDGFEKSMSGNGIRSAASYLHTKLHKSNLTMLAEIPSGVPREKPVECTWAGNFKVNMGPAINPPSMFMDERARKAIKEHEYIFLVGPEVVPVPDSEVHKPLTCFFTYVGEPDLVIFCGERQPSYAGQDLDIIVKDFFRVGAAEQDARTHENSFRSVGRHFNDLPLFPRGVNVNFVAVTKDDQLLLRSFARGINRELMASGTGAAASALIAKYLGLTKEREVPVKPRGGIFEFSAAGKKQSVYQGVLKVSVTRDTIILEGPATQVFKGDLERGP
jgi:diaminopimelate epimerase